MQYLQSQHGYPVDRIEFIGSTPSNRRNLRGALMNTTTGNSFALTVQFSFLVKKRSDANNLYESSTSLITDAINSGDFEAVFHEFALAAEATESYNATFSGPIYSDFVLKAPSGNVPNTQLAMIPFIAVLLASGVVFLVMLFGFHYYRQRLANRRWFNSLNFDDIFNPADKYLSDRLSKSGTAQSGATNDESINYISDIFINRHGIHEDVLAVEGQSAV